MGRYTEHSLSKPPIIDRVASPELGVARFKERGDYDMVVTLARMASQSNVVSEILRHSPATPIALLALNPSELVSLGPEIDASLRLNVNKRLTWEKAAAAPTGASSASSTEASSEAWVWPFMWQVRSPPGLPRTPPPCACDRALRREWRLEVVAQPNPNPNPNPEA